MCSYSAQDVVSIIGTVFIGIVFCIVAYGIVVKD